MKALAIEFYKLRRRKVWLIVAALIGAQLMWALWAFRNLNDRGLKQGWLLCLYQFPLLNSIMMPVIAAVVASRLSDAEHKGRTLKLLETVMPAGKLFDAKFLCGAAYMLAAAVLQLLVIVIAGYAKGFEGAPPVPMLGYYFLFTVGVSLTILALQQVLSLMFVNQMTPLAVGLIGSFTGLLTLFLPQGMQKYIIWGSYGALMLVGMDWDRAAHIVDYYWRPVDWQAFASLAAIFCAIYIIGRRLFVRKEI
jgi:hypothetical protein